MKLTETSAIVKISGTGAETITLNTDLLSTTQTVSGTPKVGIGYLTWTTGENIVIARNGVTVYTLFTNTGEFDLSGNGGMLDIIQGTSNLVVTITGDGVIFLTLRKIEGYASKIEPEKFGSYDNPAVVGS
jgi:uncharacterized protein (AIM24 family)